MTAVAVLTAYVGVYAHLSRRGQAEARAADYPAFFYVPLSELGPDGAGLERHHRRAAWFAPANSIDRSVFGGLRPAGRVAARESCGRTRRCGGPRRAVACRAPAGRRSHQPN
jgi:hypothetical protein